MSVDESEGASFELPPFEASDPALWFGQTECHFRLQSIMRSKDKFPHVDPCLAPEVAAAVQDLITTPPSEEPYEPLKAALISRTEGSTSRRIDHLLQEEELGDRRPTQLLRRMQDLNEGCFGVSEERLRQLFIQKLPTKVQQPLAKLPDSTDLGTLAEMAEAIMGAAKQSPPGVASLPAPQQRLDRIENDLRELNRRCDKLGKRRENKNDGLRTFLTGVGVSLAVVTLINPLSSVLAAPLLVMKILLKPNSF